MSKKEGALTLRHRSLEKRSGELVPIGAHEAHENLQLAVECMALENTVILKHLQNMCQIEGEL